MKKGKRCSVARARARAEVFKSLAHPSRVLIADALGCGEQCVREITALIGADISTVSKHLSVMERTGLLTVRKKGLNRLYRLNCDCLAAFFRCVDAVTTRQLDALQEAIAD